MGEKLESKAGECFLVEACREFGVDCHARDYENCKIYTSYSKPKSNSPSGISKSYFPVTR